MVQEERRGEGDGWLEVGPRWQPLEREEGGRGRVNRARRKKGVGRSRRRRQKTVSLLFLSSGGAAGRGERGSRN